MSKYPSGWQHDCCIGTPGDKPKCPPMNPNWIPGNGKWKYEKDIKREPDKQKDYKISNVYVGVNVNE